MPASCFRTSWLSSTHVESKAIIVDLRSIIKIELVKLGLPHLGHWHFQYRYSSAKISAHFALVTIKELLCP